MSVFAFNQIAVSFTLINAVFHTLTGFTVIVAGRFGSSGPHPQGVLLKMELH
jgi:hypothetical protein